MEYANVNVTDMTGFLTKINGVWSVSYWRQIDKDYELKGFSLPLYYDDIYAIESIIKTKDDYDKLMGASVNFEIVSAPFVIGSLFMAKLKIPHYEIIK